MRRTAKYEIADEMREWTLAFIGNVKDAENAETDEESEKCLKHADTCLDRANKLANILSATIMLEQNP